MAVNVRLNRPTALRPMSTIGKRALNPKFNYAQISVTRLSKSVPVVPLSVCRAVALSLSNNSSGSDRQSQPDSPSPYESINTNSTKPEAPKPLVRVTLNVHYRVHSRQMLCIGGSQIPFGWSFLSIAKVPMTWNQGDVWSCQVDLLPGQRIEYKYVILEEQDWTQIVSEDEGVVEITYRTGSTPGTPPDVHTITKQMAIVAWQPGPNRVLQVPTEVELSQLKPGDTVQRLPVPKSRYLSTASTQQWQIPADPYEGTWEELRMTEGSTFEVNRRDVWQWSPGPSQQVS